MTDLKEISLMDGEKILHQMEGDVYNQSPNPIMRAFGAFDKLTSKLYGKKLQLFFVQTTHRILIISKGTIFWKFPLDTVYKILSKESIDSVGYTKACRWLFFKSLYFNLSLRSNEQYEIKFKGHQKELETVVSDINDVLFSHKKDYSKAA